MSRLNTTLAKHWAFMAILTCFVLAASTRIDQFQLLEPDSSDYVIMARSLAATGEYRAYYDPSGHPFSWRPSGLSMALIPAALAFPYSVAACKAIVLLTSLLGLTLLYVMVMEGKGPRAALFVTALLACNPYTLLWSTEVVSEPLYVLGSLVVLHLLGDAGRSSHVRVVVAGLVLGLLPLVRTIGLSLTLAAVLWLLLRGRMRSLALLSPLAVIPYAAWSAIQASRHQDTYLSFALDGLSHSTIGEAMAQVVGTSLLNIRHLLMCVTPGGLAGIPMYSHTTRFLSVLPAGFTTLSTALGCCFLTLCAVGLWSRRSEAGGLALLYVAVYAGCLGLWPSRNERFLWPLLPPLLVFLPAGCRVARVRLGVRGPRLARPGSILLASMAAALIAWQTVVLLGMAATDLACRANPDAPERIALPGHYADWREAGRWLRDHTLPFERVLTGHTDLFCTSRRFQGSLLFGPQDVDDKIQVLPARYIAVSDGQFGSSLKPRLEYGDWVYEFRRVYQRRGVTILEVLPNRTGTISRTPIDRDDSLSRITAQIREEPWRFDLHSARAAMLLASGRAERACRDWLNLVSSGRAYGETYLALALESLRARRFDQAIRYIKAAAAQPDSDPSESTRTVWQLAQAGVKGEHQADNDFAVLVDYARWLARERRLDDAAAEFDRLVEENARSGCALIDRGEFYQRLGMVDRARADFERALALNEIGAEFKIELILREQALGRAAPSHFSVGRRSVDVDPASPDSHRRYAEMLVADGVPGHALAVLERAVDRFGERPDLLVPLAKLYCDFGCPLQAVRLFRTVLSQHPRNVDALIGVDRCGELERPPSY